MKALFEDSGELDPTRLRDEATRMRQEINLARRKIAGLQASIDSRTQTLARLEAKLAMTSTASQATPAFVG